MSEAKVTIEMVVIPRQELDMWLSNHTRAVVEEVKRQMEQAASAARVSASRAVQDQVNSSLAVPLQQLAVAQKETNERLTGALAVPALDKAAQAAAKQTARRS